ncbi:unnamed protein product, partial [Mesorhabditis belari]|uniref:Uncharacterized protein n=1 Tax=Mesorhabditis belari TaxID=2138241 RepID=A0AAF3EAP4_9BILA
MRIFSVIFLVGAFVMCVTSFRSRGLPAQFGAQFDSPDLPLDIGVRQQEGSGFSQNSKGSALRNRCIFCRGGNFQR